MRIDGDEAVVETRVWATAGATHFVPSFAALTTLPFSARLELSVRVAGTWSPWVAGVSLGSPSFPPSPPTAALEVEIDVFRAPTAVEAARLRLRLRGPEPAAVLAGAWMLALSASDASPPAPRPAAAPGATRLDVPPRSQMQGDAAIAARICSPTCVAMALEFWRRPVEFGALAAEMFHPATDLYGVWPAAIIAAGRRGLAGYLLRFPDWDSARWCLAQGMPVIASVRYATGELTGAAVAQTPGHLVVITGWDGDQVLVNDPAAPMIETVPRRYRLDDFTRVWLERTALGYVLFPPPANGG